MSQPLYSIGTWDTEAQAYTPQGTDEEAFNLTIHQLRAAMKELRKCGYSCHRIRSPDGDHDNNDWSVLIERTDGKPVSEIRKGWQR